MQTKRDIRQQIDLAPLRGFQGEAAIVNGCCSAPASDGGTPKWCGYPLLPIVLQESLSREKIPSTACSSVRLKEHLGLLSSRAGFVSAAEIRASNMHLHTYADMS